MTDLLGRWKKRAQKVNRCWGFGADTQTCSPGPFRYAITTLLLLQGKVFLKTFTLCAASGVETKSLGWLLKEKGSPQNLREFVWDQTAHKDVAT